MTLKSSLLITGGSGLLAVNWFFSKKNEFRIYLGLHFPGDIFAGYLFGGSFGFGFYKIYNHYSSKYNWLTKN